MDQTQNARTCRYQGSCHFFNLPQKNGHSLNMLDPYCVKWPERCQIYEKRRVGAPVSITLWPAGKVM